MTINARIREARKALNMSQKDFAKAICISNSYLADVENEARKSNDRIVKLASMIFGISENWLKTGEGEMFYKSPDEKITKLISIFNELPIDFQDYVLDQIEKLLILRKKQNN
ncbi:MAG: helix-turn-helix transcriptional regulator [Treponema sp.]|jgi:transcriptional regulator with XRE-family HTH domain|nr:helix-turn-helix transcriptional regulator [Treponema sp.]